MSRSSISKKKKKRTHQPVVLSPNTPRSFVIKSGVVSKSSTRLVQDFRKVMEPNTAANLKERKGSKDKLFSLRYSDLVERVTLQMTNAKETK